MSCPCLGGLPYEQCCEPFHLGPATAPTAERLMRSRYTAYAKELPGYLLDTWHPTTRPAELLLEPGIHWYRLEIVSRSRGGMLDSEGTVEFVASYRLDGRAGSQHESSRFVREGGRWYYLDAA